MFLKIGAFVGCHGVGLSNDGYDVDFVVEPLHELDVERLESVARGRDEVQTAVDPAVRYLTSHHPRLGVQELLVLVLDVLDHRLPAVTDNRIYFSDPF